MVETQIRLHDYGTGAGRWGDNPEDWVTRRGDLGKSVSNAAKEGGAKISCLRELVPGLHPHVLEAGQ